jgi:hypothetical protein
MQKVNGVLCDVASHYRVLRRYPTGRPTPGLPSDWLPPLKGQSRSPIKRATPMQSIQLAALDVEALRTRLRKMSDEELRKFGKAARYMVSPTANMGKTPLSTFVLSSPLDSRSKWRRAEIVCGSAGHNPHTRRTPALSLPIMRSI